MAIQYIKGTEVQEKTKSGVTVVNAFATWCGPCKMLAPFLEEASNEVPVFKVDIDENQEWAKEKDIKGIPLTMIFKDGELKQKFEGFVPKEQIVAAAKGLQ